MVSLRNLDPSLSEAVLVALMVVNFDMRASTCRARGEGGLGL